MMIAIPLAMATTVLRVTLESHLLGRDDRELTRKNRDWNIVGGIYPGIILAFVWRGGAVICYDYNFG
jgi:hypothetical protein